MFTKIMEKAKNYIDVKKQFMRRTEITLQNQSAVIKNSKTQMEQITLAISDTTPGTLPSNIETNPKE